MMHKAVLYQKQNCRYFCPNDLPKVIPQKVMKLRIKSFCSASVCQALSTVLLSPADHTRLHEMPNFFETRIFSISQIQMS